MSRPRTQGPWAGCDSVSHLWTTVRPDACPHHTRESLKGIVSPPPPHMRSQQVPSAHSLGKRTSISDGKAKCRVTLWGGAGELPCPDAVACSDSGGTGPRGRLSPPCLSLWFSFRLSRYSRVEAHFWVRIQTREQVATHWGAPPASSASPVSPVRFTASRLCVHACMCAGVFFPDAACRGVCRGISASCCLLLGTCIVGML